MSYAIIRVEKHKRGNLKLADKHDERRNKTYSNKNINSSKTYMNYHLKEPLLPYDKEFDRLRKENNLKGQIKEVSNIACEYLFTSDKQFFEHIGEQETKRYFQTAFDFVCEYKDLGKENIISAVVHLDEETPHMHLVFIPVVHTTDKQGNNIDKIACSEFWKANEGNYWKSNDSYKNLQDNFHKYVVDKGFKLERGQPVGNKHIPIEQLKKLTNFENSKKALRDIEIELPDVPDVKDFNKIMFGRYEKIQKEIIAPKDKLIKQLHSDNARLYKELDKQVNIIDKAQKFEKEKKSILAEKEDLKLECKNLEINFNNKISDIEQDYEDKLHKAKREFNKDYSELEKENRHLKRIVNTVKSTIDKFIKWVCRKFDMSVESVIRDFEKENHIFLDPVKQIKKEDREKQWDMER